nr:ATP-binding protein [Nocardioides albus]
MTGTFRIVVVGGPRQAGKTTLLRTLHAEGSGSYATLDDPTTLNTARQDPAGYASFGARPRVIDEVQRGGNDLLLAIKECADNDNSPGQFILSGSSRFLTVPTLSESLAGRAVFLDLWPLSAAERTGSVADTPAALFDPATFASRDLVSTWGRDDYFELIRSGGYPEAIRVPESVRDAWFDSYVSTVTLRDVASFADIRNASAVPQLLGLVAARSGGQLVQGDLAKSLNLAQNTVRDYLNYLEIVFLAARLPAWSTNLSSRLIKTPKAYVTDSGLAASLLGVDESVAEPGHPQAGQLVETLVFTELTRQLTTSTARANLNYFRDREGREVDFVLTKRDGSIVAIEVKASATAKTDSFKHLAWMRDKYGEKFRAGYVLYLGSEVRPFGDRLAAVPVSALWEGRPLP